MTIGFSRRQMIGAGAAGLAGAATLPFWTPSGAVPDRGADRIRTGGTALGDAYRQALGDVGRRFVAPATGPEAARAAHVRPTHRLDGARAGLPDGNVMKGSDVWQALMLVNQLYWNWKLTGSGTSRALLVDQSRFMLARSGDGRPLNYTEAELASDGAADDSIHLHDDAAAKAQALYQLFDASGDRRYLVALRAMIPRVLRRFADPNRPAVPVRVDGMPAQVDGVPFTASPHGISYGTDRDMADTTTSWEVTIALAALGVYAQGGGAVYRVYAEQVYRRTMAEGRHESGNLWSGVNLKTLRSDQAYFGYPKVGASSISILGTMAMAILAARLAGVPGTAEPFRRAYRADIAALVRSMLRTQEQFGFVTSVMPVNGIFLPWEDSWTAFYHAPAFASEVLGVPGADPGGACASVLVATARAALATRTPAGLYTADWAGQLPAPADYGLLPGATGYESYYRLHPGSTFNAIAGSPQIMTNAQALAAGLAGVVAERRLRGS